MVAQGCAARPSSPKRGKTRTPWYLEDADAVPSGLAAGQPVGGLGWWAVASRPSRWRERGPRAQGY